MNLQIAILKGQSFQKISFHYEMFNGRAFSSAVLQQRHGTFSLSFWCGTEAPGLMQARDVTGLFLSGSQTKAWYFFRRHSGVEWRLQVRCRQET